MNNEMRRHQYEQTLIAKITKLEADLDNANRVLAERHARVDSLKAKVAGLESFIKDQAGSLAILEAANTKQVARIRDLESENGSLGARVGDLEMALSLAKECHVKTLADHLAAIEGFKKGLEEAREAIYGKAAR